MITINENYLKLQAGYLFPEISRRVRAFSAKNPDAKIISLGIGDVTQPLPPAIIEAMQKAVKDMASENGFHGYGPERGYDFLIDAIIENDYRSRGIELDRTEIFVSDGSKCDTGNFQECVGCLWFVSRHLHQCSIVENDVGWHIFVICNTLATIA